MQIGRRNDARRRMTQAGVWTLGLALALCAAAGAAEAPIVNNPATPGGELETLALRELWRVGGLDGELFFGVVGSVVADDAGNLYLLDTQLSEVQVLTSDGEYLRTIAREGEGPGEVRQPSDFYLAPDGRIGLLQGFPGKVVYVEQDGTPAGGFSIVQPGGQQGSMSVLVQGNARGGEIYLAGIRMRFGGSSISQQTYFVSRYSPEGEELATLATRDTEIDYANFILTEAGLDFVWNGRWDIDPEGRVYCAPERNAYRIEVRAPDGTLERVITREFETRGRTAEEKEVARRLVEVVGNQYPAPPREIGIEEDEPDIMGMYCRPDGELWVRTSRSDHPRHAGEFLRFDVFDAEGRFTHQLALAGPGDARQDAHHFIGGDRLVMVTGALDAYSTMHGASSEGAAGEAEVEPMQVICYQLER